MGKVNFKSSVGIIEELEQAVESVKLDADSIKEAQTRITGCKHAIQVFALSMEHAKINNTTCKKLKTVEME